MTSTDYEIIIVGSGPAGATLSYLFARSGVKTLLIERDSSFKREFRGPAYQPGVLADFNQMGILDELLKVPHAVLSKFTMQEQGETLLTIDFSSLPAPQNWAVAMNQGALLKKILELSSEFPNFSYLGDSTVTGLIKNNGAVEGVLVEVEGSTLALKSRLVIGADGRYSTVREAAGIALDRETSRFDVIWFDLDASDSIGYELGIKVSGEGILVTIPQEKGKVRLGWVLKKGGFEALKKEGIDKFNNLIQTIQPSLKTPLASFDECGFLDVKVAVAEKWAGDGLLLIGDAAHTASPIGAQGNKLAIDDAVSAHGEIMKALQKSTGIIKRSKLMKHITRRRREVEKVFRRQKWLETFILGFRSPLGKKVRRFFLPFFQTYFVPRMMKAMAVGFSPSKVQTGWFAFQSEYARKHRYWPLKIVKKVFETKDSCSFHLEVPSEAKGEFRYKAGQFITLRLLDKGQLHKRSYSLSSCPLEDDILRFTVKRIPGGMISNDIIDTSHVGDELLVYPPAGNFTPAKGAEQYFFLTGGSGITPCMSLIRYLLKRPSIQTISLLFSNHNAESIIFEKELELLAKRFPGKLQVVHHLSGPSSRLTKEAILAKLPRDREALHCYICGPTGLMQLGKEAFQSHGVDPSRIHQETFASLSEPFEGIKQKPSENTVVGSGETADPETVTVSLWGDTVTIPIQKGQNILSAALDEGLSPPYSCREGICGTCIAKLECGKVSMEKTTALSDKEIEEGMILTCQAIPQTEKTTVKY